MESEGPEPELLTEIFLAADFLTIKWALEVMALELVRLFTSHWYIILQDTILSSICVTKVFHNISALDSQNLCDAKGRLPSHLLISSSHWIFRVVSSGLTKKLIKTRVPFSKDLAQKTCLLWRVGSWALWRMLTTERGWSGACWLRTPLGRQGMGPVAIKLWGKWRAKLRSAMWKRHMAKYSKS